MAVCPAGHDSAATDYCDTCGTRMAPASGSTPSVGPQPAPVQRVDLTGPIGMPSGSSEPCPDCGVPRIDEDRFCEDCGFDFVVAKARPTPAATVPTPVSSGGSNGMGAGGSGPSVPTGRDITLPSVRAAMVAATAAAAAQGAPPPPCGKHWFAEVSVDRDYFLKATVDDDSLACPQGVEPRVIPLTTEQVRVGRHSSTREDPEIDLSVPPADPGISRLHAVLMKGQAGWELIDPGSANGTTLNDDPAPLTRNVPVPIGNGDRIHLGAWTTITLREHTAENGR